MSRLHIVAVCAIIALCTFSFPLFAQKNHAVTADARTMTIAVADFTGNDKELGRFIADSVLTDLAQSSSLSLVERTEIRQAFTELKLQATGLTEPKKIKELGRLVSADRLLVGSFLIRENKIFVNARLLDVRTGRLSAGGAASVSGDKGDLLSISHRLARLFHKRLTGSELKLDEEQETKIGHRADIASTEEEATRFSAHKPFDDSLTPLREKGLIPMLARPNQVLTERELSALISRVIRSMTRQTENPINLTQPTAPVTRLRALASLVKVAVQPGIVASYRDNLPDAMPPDANAIPAWGNPFVAAAIEQGLWNATQPLRAREQATWAFVGAIMEQMGLLDSAPLTLSSRTAPREADADAYTGLIVDATDLNLKRCMSPRIVDENGRVLYPDARHLPDYDFLLDNGMASYHESAPKANRAGSRPLIIRAIDVTGSLEGDLVVSARTAEKILAANERGRFLSRWAVCFLVGQEH